jgi:uncharacterized protein YjcR
MGKSYVYTKDQIEKAHQLYLKYTPYEEMAAMTGMSVYAMKWYAKKGWRKERDLLKSQIIDLLGESKAKSFAEIGKHGMDLLVRSLQEHTRNGTILSVKEALALSNIITNIDKIVRLEDGLPTDIVKDIMPADQSEIIELVQADPFYKQLPAKKERK